MMASENATAKAAKIGARHGEAYAREIARKAASGPFDRRRIGPDMQAHLEHQGRLYGAAGWSVDDAMVWAGAFVAAAEPILTPLAEGRPVSLPATGLAEMAERVRACAPSAEIPAEAPVSADESPGLGEAPAIVASSEPAETVTERRLTLIFDGPEERTRFYAICPQADASENWVLVGTEQAEGQCVPKLMQGVYGLDEATIERNIAKVGRAGEKGLREGKDPLSRDLVFCYRIGFRSRMRVAKEALLSQLSDTARREGEAHGLTAGRQLVKAARTRPELRPFLEGALIESAALASGTGRQAGLGDADLARWQAAFLGAAVPIVREAERAAPPRPNLALILPPSASAGPSTRRPLRPEDFGALPSAPRP